MAHRQLKYQDRKQIEKLIVNGCSQAAIARAIHVHRSTIKNEIDRNSEQGRYSADIADRKSRKRKSKKRTALSPTAKPSFSLKRKRLRGRRNRDLKLLKLYANKKNDLHHIGLSIARHNTQDFRKNRKERVRFSFSFRQQMQRAFLLSQRRRDHYFERLYRRERTWLTWQRYNRSLHTNRFQLAFKSMPHYIRFGRTVLRKSAYKAYERGLGRFLKLRWNIVLNRKSISNKPHSTYTYIPYAFRKRYTRLISDQRQLETSKNRMKRAKVDRAGSLYPVTAVFTNNFYTGLKRLQVKNSCKGGVKARRYALWVNGETLSIDKTDFISFLFKNFSVRCMHLTKGSSKIILHPIAPLLLVSSPTTFIAGEEHLQRGSFLFIIPGFSTIEL